MKLIKFVRELDTVDMFLIIAAVFFCSILVGILIP